MSITRLPQFVVARLATLEETNRANCKAISRLQQELAKEQQVTRSLSAENRRLRAMQENYDVAN
jgi:hypothetical protein